MKTSEPARSEWDFRKVAKNQEACCLAYELTRERVRLAGDTYVATGDLRGGLEGKLKSLFRHLPIASDRLRDATVEQMMEERFYIETDSPVFVEASKKGALPWQDRGDRGTLVARQRDWERERSRKAGRLSVDGPLEELPLDQLERLSRRIARIVERRRAEISKDEEFPEASAFYPTATLVLSMRVGDAWSEDLPTVAARQVKTLIRQRQAAWKGRQRSLDARRRITQAAFESDAEQLLQTPKRNQSAPDADLLAGVARTTKNWGRQRASQLRCSDVLRELGVFRVFTHFLGLSKRGRGDRERAYQSTHDFLERVGADELAYFDRSTFFRAIDSVTARLRCCANPDLGLWRIKILKDFP